MGFNPIVADLLLAHRPTTLSAVARIYQQHDFAEERARALEAWSSHVMRAADSGRDSTNVLHLPPTQRTTRRRLA
jgi:hypothetical protein